MNNMVDCVLYGQQILPDIEPLPYFLNGGGFHTVQQCRVCIQFIKIFIQ